jgi:tRNA (guanine-N7-)-methyltransferase
MPRTKLRKFAEIESFERIVEPTKPYYSTMPGQWKSFLGTSGRLVVELACGYGEYTNGLAELMPNDGFVGVDIKGERVWRGMKKSIAKNLDNTAFLRAEIAHLSQFFAPQEIDELWIIHPDPFPKTSHERKRLTHPHFLEIYKGLLKPSSWVHFKTDNKELYEYSLLSIVSTEPKKLHATTALHQDHLASVHANVRTRFEQKALDNDGTIYAISYQI